MTSDCSLDGGMGVEVPRASRALKYPNRGSLRDRQASVARIERIR